MDVCKSAVGIVKQRWGKRKEMSLAMVLDLIVLCLCYLRGPFDQSRGWNMMNVIREMSEKDKYFKVPRGLWHHLEVVLNTRDHPTPFETSRKAVAWFCEQERPQLEYSIFDSCNFEIIVTRTHADGYHHLGQFCVESEYPVYVDTESVIAQCGAPTPPYGENVALLIFCDVVSCRVLLWRIHTATFAEVREIRRHLVNFNRTRSFASFGPENFFENINVINLQNNQKSLQGSLKEVNYEIYKTETMSDWTRPKLRKDQLYYAAMDAYALHKLYVNNYQQRNFQY